MGSVCTILTADIPKDLKRKDISNIPDNSHILLPLVSRLYELQQDHTNLVKKFTSNLPTFKIDEIHCQDLFFSGDEVRDINDQMVIIRSKSYDIIIPFVNKVKAFEKFGFNCSDFLNLIDKDILVKLKLPNNEIRFKTFSWRQAILNPDNFIYYTLEFRHNSEEFVIYPWLTPKLELNCKSKLVNIFAWKSFPHSTAKEQPNPPFRIFYNCPNYSYDISKVMSAIKTFILSNFMQSPPPYNNLNVPDFF